MAACDVGRMSLYIRSILWDLDIPQEAATIAYEDNGQRPKKHHQNAPY